MFIEIAEKILNAYFACIPRGKPTPELAAKAKLIAHRGAHSKRLGVIENTMESFAKAQDLGCWGIEIDIQTTADGVLVVNHDPTLNRLWEKPVAIADVTFDVLRALEPRIPSLQEVVNIFGKNLHLFIELKPPFHAEKALKDILQNYKPGQDYHLLSLEEPLFAAFTLFPKETMLLVPIHNNVAEFCKLSLEKGYGGVLGNYLLLNDKRIQQLRTKNQRIGVGFVNSPFSLSRELSRQIFWIFSDDVYRIKTYLDSL